MTLNQRGMWQSQVMGGNMPPMWGLFPVCVCVCVRVGACTTDLQASNYGGRLTSTHTKGGEDTTSREQWNLTLSALNLISSIPMFEYFPHICTPSDNYHLKFGQRLTAAQRPKRSQCKRYFPQTQARSVRFRYSLHLHATDTWYITGNSEEGGNVEGLCAPRACFWAQVELVKDPLHAHSLAISFSLLDVPVRPHSQTGLHTHPTRNTNHGDNSQ